MWTGLIQFLVASLLVIAAAAWGSRALVRWLKPAQGGRDLEIRSVVSLGGRRVLCVVRWHGDELLLGVTDQGVSLLDRRAAREDEPA
ncbi:FliO/MopB family protein [Thermaerobacter subterraneus]|uniref:Flagellar biogenesis protein n=1 Tax=Thermaerobacter subterraneus DSM 13965 TaxID=867903 RepID=K6PY71_9FIRM|nr:flagellar biosynthetic protein FliO [Thermaerobacter subterraneus]EKP93668.1 flagellar biogenesis protein [Thermaerobacter subterraneus DSM 13965]